MAPDRAALAKRLDRTEDRRWFAGGGTFRAHQVPLLVDPEHPEHVALLESWMRSYRRRNSLTIGVG